MGDFVINMGRKQQEKTPQIHVYIIYAFGDKKFDFYKAFAYSAEVRFSKIK